MTDSLFKLQGCKNTWVHRKRTSYVTTGKTQVQLGIDHTLVVLVLIFYRLSPEPLIFIINSTVGNCIGKIQGHVKVLEVVLYVGVEC
jgi:hypothetical protein